MPTKTQYQKKLIKCWGADNDGQLKRNGNNKNHIGKWAISDTNERQNAKMISE